MKTILEDYNYNTELALEPWQNTKGRELFLMISLLFFMINCHYVFSKLKFLFDFGKCVHYFCK